TRSKRDWSSDVCSSDLKDKTAFTKRMGIGTFIVGLGTFLIPVLNLLTQSELGYFVGLCSITFGAFLLIVFIIKYNGTLFSFKKKIGRASCRGSVEAGGS